ncbi:Gfo/Idh/MocA family oxidoreductase [Paenibacillus hemerocallicola]|uniref:Gfo/Idh/MocA family oxidoreductase n=1 Tax=Paenibacillus hemerocallicola TaxID=1172614 RepID=A0A5C4SVR8_9BACL|nr:Gfo/Idh/MocA family oxidoreductase [Paenibacillus hemerocallicola]TNJ54505.1 Gfo/Idh/MocA family oxidoreductase [Paenibacillus hemerocallicola]
MIKRKALLIGVNGFGEQHLNELLHQQDLGVLELAAVSDLRLPEQTGVVIAERGIRYYEDYKDMLDKERGADFVIVSTPIQLHAPMGIDAMEAGYHVLLEKPPAAVIQDAERIAETARRTGKRCAVNFFTPSAKAMAMLTGIAASGEIGEIRAIKGISLLNRPGCYFTRTPWAGKLTVRGVTVLDGSFHNPAAHLFYSMLCLSERLAVATGKPDALSRVTAELYRGNAIESDDTSCLRVDTEGGPAMHLYITLCARHTETQRIRIEGADGAAEWSYDDKVTVWKDADSVVYDCKEGSFLAARYRNLIGVIEGREERLDVPLESAKRFTLAANGAFESAGSVKAIPDRYLQPARQEGDPGVYVEGIEETIRTAFREGKLFSEIGVPWAAGSEPFDLAGYRSFPQKFRLNG